jgi:predicted extracellular nuclease
MQEESADQDQHPATSEGLFIYDNGTAAAVNPGTRVRVTGRVAEFNDLTELAGPLQVVICGSGPPPAPTPITLPEAANGDLERYEGMQVTFTHPLTVSQTFFLGRYGQLTLAGPDAAGKPGRLFQPTSQFPPGSAAAAALADTNARRLLVLDDGRDLSGLGDPPNPVPYLGSPPPRVIRAGDTVSHLTGVLDQGRINASNPPATDYRLQPTVPPVFGNTNPRSATPPPVGGTLTVAAFNVLNYFTTFNRRGANNANEFQRQKDKIIAALAALDADIVGLMEVENNGYGPNSAIQDLVNALNSRVGANTYAFINPGLAQLGVDAIAVGLLYKPAKVTPVGPAATLQTGAFSPDHAPSHGGDGGYSRPPLAQTFKDAANGRFTVVVNHFKSKRPAGSPTGGNLEANSNGQGAWNQRRVEAATDLANWLARDPTHSLDSDLLIIGDLNAYAQEEPLTTLQGRGYVNLIGRFVGPSAYSYSFDGLAGYLDHSLASDSLTTQVSGAGEWHINADEPAVLDYNQALNPPGYYRADPYRASDHDPLLIGLRLQPRVPVSLTGDAAVGHNDIALIERRLGQPVTDPEDQHAVDDGCHPMITRQIDKNCYLPP